MFKLAIKDKTFKSLKHKPFYYVLINVVDQKPCHLSTA